MSVGMSQHLQIVLVMHDSSAADAFSAALTSAGHIVATVFSVPEARATLRRDVYDALVTDATVEASGDGVGLAEEVLAMPTRPEVIVLSRKPNVKEAVSLVKAGAHEYEPYPVTGDELLGMIGAACRGPENTLAEEDGFDEFLRAFMLSSVPEVQEMAALCRTVASRSDATALIVGESSAGKGVVSRIIHWLSPQSRAPLVRINLVDVEPEEIQSKLFGTESGEDGLLSAANAGTLLVREFSEAQPGLQTRLRDLLETRTYSKEHGVEGHRFNGRFLATSTLGADDLVSARMLDPGLAYRMATVTIRVPPLRDRVEDLPRITDAVLSQVAWDASRPELRLSGSAQHLLFEHPWSGNLRELRNVLTRLALLCPSDEISADDLAQALGFPSAESRRAHKSGVRTRVRSSTPKRPRNSSVPVPHVSGLISAALDDTARAERERIESALEASEGHRERAAAVLGMSRTTLWTRMRLLGIDYERFPRPTKAKAEGE